jgi:hypothetical protein
MSHDGILPARLRFGRQGEGETGVDSLARVIEQLLVPEQLSQVTDVDPAEFAEEIFSVDLPLLTLSPEQVITANRKEYGRPRRPLYRLANRGTELPALC